MANDDNRERKGRWQGFDFGGGGGSGGGSGGPGGPGSGQRSPLRFSLAYIIGAVLVLLIVQSLFFARHSSATYSTFVGQLNQHQVAEVDISDTSITWKDKDGQQFSATVPASFQSTALFDRL